MTEDAGRLNLEVVSETDGFRRDLKAKLDAELRGLRAEAAVRARVEVDRAQIRRELATKLAQASNRVKAQVNVDINEARLRAALTTALRGVRIPVEADITRARASTETFRREQQSRPVNLPVNVNTSGLRRAGAEISRLGTDMVRTFKFPALASGALLLAGTIGNLTGGLFALTSSASQAVGVLAALPNLAGIAAQGIATLITGFVGIGDAVKALGKAHEQTGTTATRSGAAIVNAQEQVARAQESAAERVQAAQQALADVQRQAADSVAEAERRVTAAHQARVDALADLSAALEEAREKQEDLALAVSGGQLDEEGARLAVERAAERLREVTQAGSTAGGLDRREADLAYRQALQRLAEVQERNGDLAREKSRADREGIAGDDQVQAAKRRVTEATQAEIDAQRALTDTRRQAARDVAAAQAAIVTAQRDGARQVADAQRSLAQAMAAAGAAAPSAAMTALALAMDKLSPAGRRFALFIDGVLKPRLRELQHAVQEALLPHLQRAITIGMPLLDTFETGLVDTAKRIGSFTVDLAKMVSAPAFRSDIASIMASNNRALSSFGDAGLHLINIMRKIAVVAGPLLVEPFAKWTKQLAAAADAGATTERITDFLTRARDTAKTLAGIIGDVVGGLYNLGQASRPTGDSLLSDLADAARRFNEWTSDEGNQARFREFFEQTIPVMQQVGDLLVRVTGLFFRFGEATGGGTFNGLLWALDLIVTALERIAALPGGGAALSALFSLAGAGLALGLVAKGVGGIAKSLAGIAKLTGVTKILGALSQTTAGTAVGVRGLQAAEAIRGLPGRAAKGARTAAGKVAERAGRVGTAVRGAVQSRIKAGGGRERGSLALTAPTGLAIPEAVTRRLQAARDQVARIGQAASRAALSVRTWAASMANAARAQTVAAFSRAGGAIRTAAVAAGQGVLAFGRLTLAIARSTAAAVLNAARTAAVTAVTWVVRGATLAWAAAQRILNLVMRANPLGLIITVIGLVIAAVVYAYNNFGWFRRGVQAAWKGIQAAAQWAWQHIIQPVFRAVSGFIRNTLVPGFLWLLRTNRTVWRGLWGVIQGAWRIVRGIFVSIRTWITETVPNAFRRGIDAVGRFWKRLQEYARRPVAFVINTIYNKGVVPMWNWIADKVGLGRLNTIKGFRRGGITSEGALPGYTPGRDVGLAAVSGGEAIMRPEWTRAVGPALINLWNRLARTGGARAVARAVGGMAGGFRRGGVVPGGLPFAGHYDLGGIVSGFFSAAKNFFARGLRKALTGVLDPLVSAVEAKFGNNGFGKLIAAIPKSWRNSIVSYLMQFRDQLEGGDAAGVVAAAKKYLGVGDDRGRDNDNRFTRQWGWPAGTPWCALFVSSAIKDAKAGKLYPGYPSAAVASYKNAMRHVGIGAGQPGDLAAYRGDGHINIITGKTRGAYKTIGGNEGPVVRAGVRGGQSSVLRPKGAYARGGVVEATLRRVFGQEIFGVADPADRHNPLTALYTGLVRSGARVLNRDLGGPIGPGLSLLRNATRRREWVLNPDAVELLGGGTAVDALNSNAAHLYRTRRAATPTQQDAEQAGGGATVNVYPQAGQSEMEIAMVTSRKLGALVR